MDKIYDALRKLSSKSSKAQNTNSEYFVIGMLRVRVSDHTSNEMACHSNHLYVLTHNNRKNLYTAYRASFFVFRFTKYNRQG